MTVDEALKMIATVIMTRVQGTGQEHTAINQALNVIHEALKPKEEK